MTPVIPSGVNGIAFGLALDANGSLTVDDLGIDDAAPTGSPTRRCRRCRSPRLSGATLSGVAQLSATASDNVALDHVEFLVDGQVVGLRGRMRLRR